MINKLKFIQKINAFRAKNEYLLMACIIMLIGLKYANAPLANQLTIIVFTTVSSLYYISLYTNNQGFNNASAKKRALLNFTSKLGNIGSAIGIVAILFAQMHWPVSEMALVSISTLTIAFAITVYVNYLSKNSTDKFDQSFIIRLAFINTLLILNSVN